MPALTPLTIVMADGALSAASPAALSREMPGDAAHEGGVRKATTTSYHTSNVEVLDAAQNANVGFSSRGTTCTATSTTGAVSVGDTGSKSVCECTAGDLPMRPRHEG